MGLSQQLATLNFKFLVCIDPIGLGFGSAKGDGAPESDRGGHLDIETHFPLQYISKDGAYSAVTRYLSFKLSIASALTMKSTRLMSSIST